MIVEELIYFEQKKLRHVASLENKVTLIKTFFAELPPTSPEKLNFFISLLKERELDEKPYTYPILYALLTGCLVASTVIWGLSFFSDSKIASLRPEIFILTLLLCLAWIILNWSINNAKKRKKYQGLIHVLELYHLEIMDVG